MFNNLYRCVVEDNKDPEHFGRVRLRVVGVHDKKLKFVPVDTLPWSDVLNPIDAGNSFGSSTNVIQGTWGYCVALNESHTEFLFIGTIKGVFKEQPQKQIDGNDVGFRDPDGVFPKRLDTPDNKLTYGAPQDDDVTQDRVKVFTDIETDDTAQNAKYPKNKVYEDMSGNIMEIDGTDGNSRIRIQHSSGARIEINKDGDITLATDGKVWIKGDLKIEGDILLSGDIIGDAGKTNISLVNHTHTGNLGSPTTIPTPSA